MHAPKHIQGALLGAALAASLAVAPATHAAADPPARLGYVASFHTQADCRTVGTQGIEQGRWGTFYCVEQGDFWHLLLKLDEVNHQV